MAQYKYDNVNIRVLIKELKTIYPSGVSIQCDSLDDTSCMVIFQEELNISQQEIDEVVNNLDLARYEKEKKRY